MVSFKALGERALRPVPAFAARAAEAPALGGSLRDLVLLRAPVALVASALLWVRLADLAAALRSPDSALWRQVLEILPTAPDPGELAEALARIPALPSLGSALPWLALLAPLGVLGLWLHHATLDHLGLMILGGARRGGWRATLSAEAEALQVGVLGALLALPGHVPGAPWWLSLLLVPAAVYFWLLRGAALAAWHGCPLWKGLAATVLNPVLAGLLLLLAMLPALLVLGVALAS
ncbi:MAG TPA: hypothetical protein VK188_18935 [Holophaga sp.]|nr:hypothetical protein [Holophaga sp.]